MLTNDVITQTLSRVREAADQHHGQIVHTSEILRADRELLMRTGWLQEIIRGWYMLVRPDTATGDTAAWYANFWDFVRLYLQHRFQNQYCLTAESSLDLLIENPRVPNQVIVIVKHGAGLTKLMYDTSLMMYVDLKAFPKEMSQKNGINVMSLPYALCKVAPTYFQHNAQDAELALRTIKRSDELSRLLIRYNLKSSASRILGAYQFLNDTEMAKNINAELEIGGLIVNPTNPFLNKTPLLTSLRSQSPFVGRIQGMWSQARETVIANFPDAPGLPKNNEAYLHKVDEIYQYDAYNSLSIEGYQVTHELINRVKNSQWDPIGNNQDNNIKNAMAAKGYFDTFQQVKQCVKQVLEGEKASHVVKNNLQKWYQMMFGPSARAGIIPSESLLGFRQNRVFIKNSRHFPPSQDVVVDAMEAFFDCLKNEPHPAVNAVLGHYFFVYIHPYMDGNGRLSRFLMNLFLASGGYPWTVVRVDNRSQYISILENSHNKFDMTDFTQFIHSEMESSKALFAVNQK
jgi:hypothetical protein